MPHGSLLWGAPPIQRARAQETEAEAEPVLVPPSLVQFASATYPEAAAEYGLEGTVELELTIDAEGRVTDAIVVTPAGSGFDEAAAEAARRFLFEPATRDAEPIPSIIRYRYVFELTQEPEVEEVEDEAPPPGLLEGQVLDAGDDAPIVDAAISVQMPGETTQTPGETTQMVGEGSVAVVSDADGRFSVGSLAPGSYEVRIAAEGFEAYVSSEEVASGEATSIVYRMLRSDASASSDTFSATAVADPPPREVVRRSIQREQLTRIPGTRGDALRAVEILPGVGRPAFGAGALIIRGSAPEDSTIRFHGVEVPLLYHFGGLTSFYNSRLLEQIDFYPGNFSARYGRKTGGVLEVSSRDPASDRLHGVIETSFIDVSLMLEFPITDELSMAIAARRSVLDFFIETLIPDDTLDIVTAPVYEDYQLILSWRPTPNDRFRFQLYGVRDTFKILLSDGFAEDDPSVRGNANLDTQFHFGHLSWDHTYAPGFEQETNLRVGPTNLDFGLGDEFSFQGRFLEITLRTEWRARLAEWARVIVGTDLDITPFSIDYVGPQPRQIEGTGQDEPLSTQEQVIAQPVDQVYRPGFYVETELRPVEPLLLNLGFRADYYSEIDKWSFDPRSVAVYSVTDQTRIKGGVGLYSQPPEFQESIEEIGNPNLDPFHSVHVGLGVEHDFTETIEVGVEGFYKWLWDRVVETENGEAPFFRNKGVGRIYGMEISAQVRPTKGFFGYLSYTLSRSERRDAPGESFRPFDFDQTHIFNLAAVYQLPKGWEVGTTLRLVSGNPDTPVAGSSYDANNDVYLAVNGDINSGRAPLFHRLDVRIEKKWAFDLWKFAIFLDVQNVYNATNSEGTIYNFDYTESTALNGLPIIPALGMRGEL